MTGCVVWITGMSGAGKSTLAQHLVSPLKRAGARVELLDGDDMRTHLCAGLGYSKADRDTNVRRIAYVGRLVARHDVIAVAAVISPYRDIRDEQRRLTEADGSKFCEVHMDCPVEILVARDVKGLYRRALCGEIPQFTGISAPYEPPISAEVVVRSDRDSVDRGVALVMAALGRQGVLTTPTGSLLEFAP